MKRKLWYEKLTIYKESEKIMIEKKMKKRKQKLQNIFWMNKIFKKFFFFFVEIKLKKLQKSRSLTFYSRYRYNSNNNRREYTFTRSEFSFLSLLLFVNMMVINKYIWIYKYTVYICPIKFFLFSIEKYKE